MLYGGFILIALALLGLAGSFGYWLAQRRQRRLATTGWFDALPEGQRPPLQEDVPVGAAGALEALQALGPGGTMKVRVDVPIEKKGRP